MHFSTLEAKILIWPACQIYRCAGDSYDSHISSMKSCQQDKIQPNNKFNKENTVNN